MGNLVEDSCTDQNGQIFHFPENRHNHYYKNDIATSRLAEENHAVATAFYKVHRARRLPLLKPIIQQTPLIVYDNVRNLKKRESHRKLLHNRQKTKEENDGSGK